MPVAHRITVVDHPRCQLGEAPVWCPDSGALQWADIFGCAVHRLAADGTLERWETGSRVGALALGDPGALVLGLKRGIERLDLADGSFTPLADPEAGLPGNRYNDCAVDARGRLWIGSLDDSGVAGRGALHRIEADGSATAVLRGVGLANGVGFSPGGRRLYFTDTTASAIFVHDCDPDSGRLGPARLFARDDDCAPDGLAVDAEGGVWSAKWGGGRVVRYRPDGAVDRVVETPVSNPTSVAFGGPALDRLYITTASIDLADPDELRRGAGQLLALDDPGVAGLPARRCALTPSTTQNGAPHAG